MNAILPDALWVGHAGDDRDVQGLFAAGIKAIVQLAAEESMPQLPREIVFCHFPLVDGEGNPVEWLDLAIGALAALLDAKVPTLVTCGAGMSRSPAIAAAALAILHNEPPEIWLARVAKQHPIDVSPGLWGDITRVLTARSARRGVRR